MGYAQPRGDFGSPRALFGSVLLLVGSVEAEDAHAQFGGDLAKGGKGIPTGAGSREAEHQLLNFRINRRARLVRSDLVRVRRDSARGHGVSTAHAHGWRIPRRLAWFQWRSTRTWTRKDGICDARGNNKGGQWSRRRKTKEGGRGLYI